MDICVFGAGSLGSLVGGLLATEHEVTLVGRDPHVGSIRRNGLQITGECDKGVEPEASKNLPSKATLAIVTVKSFDTARAASALAEVELDGVLTLQNGMGNEAKLVSELDCPVLAGTCTYGARLGDPGTVECTGIGSIALGPREGGDSTFASRVGDAFSRAGLQTTVAPDMPRRLWEKLAVNAGINAPTALARIPNGAIADGWASEVGADAARETAQVARKHGIDISDVDAVSGVQSVARATAKNTSSMQQDVLAGKRTEIDAINGYVFEHATEPVPVNETLTRLIRSWEVSAGVRADDA